MHSVKSGMSSGPSWMFVDAPGSLHGNVVLIVCPNFQCRAVLGSFYELVAMPKG